MPSNEQRRQAAKRHLERQLQRRVERSKRRRTFAVAGSAAGVIVLVGLIVLVVALTGGGDEDIQAGDQQNQTETDAPTTEEQPVEVPTGPPAEAPVRPQPLPASVDCQYAPAGEAAKPVNPPAAGPTSAEGTVAATMQTSAGPIGLTLHRDLAPCTVASFLSLSSQGYFDDTPCHRLVTNPGLQVLQCGDPSGQGTGGPGYGVPDEVFDELTYPRGYVAMANSGSPNSGGSQFFLIYGDSQLPPSYTVFATVNQEGLDTLGGIAEIGDDGSFDPSPGGGAPIQPVTIESVQIAQ